MAAVRATRSPVSLATSQTDRRSALAGAAEEAALRDEVKAALTGEAWAGTDAQIRDIASELSRLRRSTSTAQAAMLESGRRLLRLQELAGEGGYRALHRAEATDFVVTSRTLTMSRSREDRGRGK